MDFAAVDPRLGAEVGLKHLIDACHDQGLRIVLDAAFTHCHRDHAAFQELLQHQQKSSYCEWFQIVHFPVTAGDPSTYRHYPDHPELPLLDLSKAAVVHYFKRIIAHWMELGIDGLRFDAVEFGPSTTWRELAEYARQINPEAAIIAECVFESVYWAYHDLGVDATTDYTRYDLLLHTLALGSQSAKQATRLDCLYRHRQGPLLDQIGLRFIDTHDTDRFLTHAKSESCLRAALTYLLLRSEPVMLYYGTELALTSHCKTKRREDAWPDRAPMPKLDADHGFACFVRELLSIRNNLRRLEFGPARPLEVADGILAFERVSASGSFRVLVNVTAQSQPIGVFAENWFTLAETHSSLVPVTLEGHAALAITTSSLL